MEEKKHILIVCGEPSGDIHAGNLARKILEINPNLKISGVGGTYLQKAGVGVFYDIRDIAVIGIFDVLKKLPKFFALQRLILEKIKKENPRAIILVDFSGFNLRLAKKINRAIPVIYYISPQVWASRQGRIKTIRRYIDKIIVIFKFEEEFYKKFGIDADSVGHPLLDAVQLTMEKEEFLKKFNLSESKKTIALLPGSRKSEIENILPVMLKASDLIAKEMPDIQFIIAKPSQLNLDVYSEIIQNYNLDLKIIEGRTYDCINIADFCLVSSGTATIETAIMQKPFVIIYRMNTLNYIFYRPQVRVPYIGMVNIVARRKIIPEFIQSQAVPKKIKDEVLRILRNPKELEEMKNNLSQIKSLLGESGSSLRAAKIIVDFMHIGTVPEMSFQ